MYIEKSLGEPTPFYDGTEEKMCPVESKDNI